MQMAPLLSVFIPVCVRKLRWHGIVFSCLFDFAAPDNTGHMATVKFFTYFVNVQILFLFPLVSSSPWWNLWK